MNKDKKKKRHLNAGSQKMRLGTSMSLIIISGSSALLITVCLLIYLNFSRMQTSKAGNLSERIIPEATLQTDMEVTSLVITPAEQQPAGRNQHEIINKRRLTDGKNNDLH
jgi:hypothetical protein